MIDNEAYERERENFYTDDDSEEEAGVDMELKLDLLLEQNEND